MTPYSNCYELLGVSPSANNAELRKAFRELSKRLHPDTTSLPSGEATRQFQNVCEAYDLLSDPVLRANYDLSIEKDNNLMSQNKEPYLTNIKPVPSNIRSRNPPLNVVWFRYRARFPSILSST